MQHRDMKFLFTGDTETQAEDDMLAAGVVSDTKILRTQINKLANDLFEE